MLHSVYIVSVHINSGTNTFYYFHKYFRFLHLLASRLLCHQSVTLGHVSNTACYVLYTVQYPRVPQVCAKGLKTNKNVACVKNHLEICWG